MEKEFFENALKQKRYQNNMISKGEESKGQGSPPAGNQEAAAKNEVEKTNQESSESPQHGSARSPIVRNRYPIRPAIRQTEGLLRRVPTGTELATI